jgi:hypothetical protein
MAEKLKQSLDLYHMDTLKQIAEHLNVSLPKGPVRKAWIVDAVSDKVREIAGSTDFIGTLSQAERALLGLLLKNGGVGTQRTITLPLMKAGLIYVEGQDSTIDRPRLRDVALSLMRKGLLLNLDDIGSLSTRRTFEPFDKIGVAPEVSRMLPRNLLAVPEPSTVVQTVAAPPRIESTDAELCLRQLFFLWAELRREPVSCLKSGGIGKRDVRRIAKSLIMDEERDIERLRWMQAILQALNVLKSTATTIGAADTDAVKLFWGASPRVQLATILQSYPNVAYDLTLSLNTVVQYAYYSSIPIRPSKEIRGQVLNLLKEIAEAQWFPFSLFVAFLNEGRSGSLVVADHTLNSLYTNLRWYAAGRRDDLTTALQQLDQQAALAVLKELQTLGVVELGYPASGEVPTALQLTPLALVHFANQPVPTSENGGQGIVIRRDITVLQTDDTETLDRLLNDKTTGRLLHRLDAHTAWLRAKDTAKLEAHLRLQEMLPAYSQGPEADLPHSLRWDQDALRPRHPMPSLYVTGTLRRVATLRRGGPQSGDHWELTRQSVRAAVAAGMDVPAVIALVEQMTGVPMTPEWHKQLKAWGNHYGDAQMASVVLLRLESDEALQELRRADRRLSRWIRPLPHAAGLGVVDAKHYDEVQALLAEWGIAIEDKPWW